MLKPGQSRVVTLIVFQVCVSLLKDSYKLHTPEITEHKIPRRAFYFDFIVSYCRQFTKGLSAPTPRQVNEIDFLFEIEFWEIR